MTRVLLVKMSSLGDVVHTLPALTDAALARPGIVFDWVVEEAYASIVRLHPAVRDALPIALRRWRRTPWQSRSQWRSFRARVAREHYDLVLDAQGLLKSAFVSSRANGERVGLDARSAREPLASIAYSRPVRVAWQLHAVERVRQLFANALEYALPNTQPVFGIRAPALPIEEPARARGYLLFLHGTTWANKQWPTAYWEHLCALATAEGWAVRIAAAGGDERARAERITRAGTSAQLLPVLALDQLLPWLAHAAGVVAVDSGLGHLAAAFGVPTLMLYGPTDPRRTGALGLRVRNLDVGFSCAPCLQRHCSYRGPLPLDDAGAVLQPACLAAVTPELVWTALEEIRRS